MEVKTNNRNKKKSLKVKTNLKAGAQANGRKTVRGHDILLP